MFPVHWQTRQLCKAVAELRPHELACNDAVQPAAITCTQSAPPACLPATCHHVHIYGNQLSGTGCRFSARADSQRRCCLLPCMQMLNDCDMVKDSTKQLVRQRLEDPTPPSMNALSQALELPRFALIDGSRQGERPHAEMRSSAPSLPAATISAAMAGWLRVASLGA